MLTHYDILKLSSRIGEVEPNKFYFPLPKMWNIRQNLFVSARALSCFMNSEWCCRWWSNKVVTGAAGVLTVSVRANSVIWVQSKKKNNPRNTISLSTPKSFWARKVFLTDNLIHLLNKYIICGFKMVCNYTRVNFGYGRYILFCKYIFFNLCRVALLIWSYRWARDYLSYHSNLLNQTLISQMIPT